MSASLELGGFAGIRNALRHPYTLSIRLHLRRRLAIWVDSGNIRNMARSLESFRRLRWALIAVKRLYYQYIWGMDIHPSARFSLSARFDLVYPQGVHLGAESYVAFGAAIMSHDITRNLYAHTRIGRRCFIGARSTILPGVTIGDGAIVGVGSIVTKDVPARSIVAGNPSRIIREGIDVGPYGRMLNAKSPPATE